MLIRLAITAVILALLARGIDFGESARAIASITMLVGWSILAVPTGIITSEMTAQRFAMKRPPNTRTCPVCLTTGLEENARFCRNCGAKLPMFAHD